MRHHRTQSGGFLSYLQGSHGLLSDSETCFDSFRSWKQTRGLPLCLLRGQSCRHTVLKWKAKRGCFSTEPSRPLFKLSKGWASHPHFSSYTFPLTLCFCPSFLTLFVCLSKYGRSHLSGRVLTDSRLNTAGCGICGGESWWIKSQSCAMSHGEKTFKMSKITFHHSRSTVIPAAPWGGTAQCKGKWSLFLPWWSIF